MTSNVSLCAGLLVGLSVAVPIGPVGLLCIQRTLAWGMRAGVCTGLGAATINVVYGVVIIFGLGRLAPWIAGGGRVLSAVGGIFLLWTARRTLASRGVLGKRAADAPTVALSPLAAYGSAILFNATNPMAPMLMLALLSPLVGVSTPSAGDAAAFLLGMFVAAVTWWICLSGTVALLRARLSPTVLLYVNRAAGVILTFYGILALARSARP